MIGAVGLTHLAASYDLNAWAAPVRPVWKTRMIASLASSEYSNPSNGGCGSNVFLSAEAAKNMKRRPVELAGGLAMTKTGSLQGS